MIRMIQRVFFTLLFLLLSGQYLFAGTGDLSVNRNLIVNGSATISAATITGNATVNGNLGVGTSSPTQKLDVNGNVKGTGICIGTNCTTTLQVSGGLYGYCVQVSGENASCTAKSPATCGYYLNCTCPSGYTLVQLWNPSGVLNNPLVLDGSYACYKN